jgi:two-component system NtrC family sensor kinase
MREGAKPAKAKVEAKRPRARKSSKNEGTKIRDLETRLDEALDRQTATSEILRVISSSPADLQPVFDAIVRSATGLCDATHATAFRFDGQLMTLAAHHQLAPDELEIALREYPRPAARETASGRAIVEGRVVHIRDDEVRAGNQPQDCEGAWPDDSSVSADPGG